MNLNSRQTHDNGETIVDETNTTSETIIVVKKVAFKRGATVLYTIKSWLRSLRSHTKEGDKQAKTLSGNVNSHRLTSRR